MKESKNYYVYEYVCPFTNIPFYVGKGKGYRMHYHLKNLNDNTNPHKLNKIKKIIREGRNPIINVVYSDLTESAAFEFEIKLIKKYGRIDIGTGCLTNLSDGGEGQSGWIPSDEYKLKMSKSTKGSKNGMYGKAHSDETREKIRKKAIGRKLTNETKLKKSISMIGNKNHFYQKTHTKESRKKISEAKTGRFVGGKNFTAKTFKFTSPDGIISIIKGEFIKFCIDNNLSVAKMKRFIDKDIIPPLKIKAKNTTIESINCIGWSVSSVNEQ